VNRREFIALAGAVPFTWRAALAPGPLALVTCDAQARLAVVDLGTHRVVRSIATLPDPRSIELVGNRAVVCHSAIGAVSIVDGRRVLHVLRGFTEPRYTAAHPDGVHGFVTDSGHSGVVAIDVLRGRVLGRVKLPGWARHLTISERADRLWVGLGSASPQVAVVDTKQLRHVATIEPGYPAHDVGMAPDGRLWITSGNERKLIAAGSVRPADAAPQHVTFGAHAAYVTSGDDGSFHVQSLADGGVLRTARIPVGSYNVQHGWGRVLTPSLSHGTLAVLNEAGALLATVQVADSCHDACFSPA
jgi:hypothetical protein